MSTATGKRGRVAEPSPMGVAGIVTEIRAGIAACRLCPGMRPFRKGAPESFGTTATGYMLVGDSAWMPKPLDAGGIGPAIIAATIAGKDAVEALQAGDTSEKGLWKYNKHFIDDYGYKTAGLEVFRRMLQGLTNEQINFGMKHFLSKMDIDKITKGEHPEFSTVDKLGMIIRGAMNKKLAEDLRYCADSNRALTALYYDYPETPERFPDWSKKLQGHLAEAFARYK